MPVPSLPKVDNKIAGLEEQQQREASYSGGSGALKLPPQYLMTASSYVFYELYGPLEQIPSILVFSKATIDRLAPTRIFRVGSDINYRHVYWTAIRKNAWPVVPEVDESNGPLLRRKIDPIAPPVAAADGASLIYKISGHYIYVSDTPQDASEAILSPKLPFIAIDDTKRSIGTEFLENLTSESEE
jgi:hypothetical protein